MIFDNTSGSAVFSWDDLYVRSFSDAPLPIIVCVCRDQWEDAICEIMTQAPVLMLSPVPVTIPRLYSDLDIQVFKTYNSSRTLDSQIVAEFEFIKFHVCQTSWEKWRDLRLENNVHLFIWTNCGGLSKESLNSLFILRRGENAFPRLLPSTIV